MSRKKTQNKTTIVLERICKHYGFKFDADVAEFYGVSESTVSAWRTRDSINETLIRAKCNDENLANWFIAGVEIPAETPQSGLGPLEIDIVMSKTRDILNSSTTFAKALVVAIESLYESVQLDKQMVAARALLSQHGIMPEMDKINAVAHPFFTPKIKDRRDPNRYIKKTGDNGT